MKTHFKLLMILIVALALTATFALAKSDRRVKDAWLGVYTQSVDYELAEAFDLSVSYGAVVNRIADDSPAEEAGLKDGDLIIRFDDRKITDSDDLVDAIDDSRSGDEITLTIIRDGDEMTVSVNLDGRPRSWRSYDRNRNLYNFGNVYAYSDRVRAGGYIGVMLTSVSEQLGEYFGIENGEGALITEVVEDSPAEEAGLKAGDVIVEADGDDIDDPGDVSEVVSDFDKGEKINLTVLRDHKRMTFEVEVEESDHGPFFRAFNFNAPEVVLSIPDLPVMPSISVVPRISGLFHSDFDEDDAFRWDNDEIRAEMKKLHRELKKLKSEEMSHLRREMGELREELKDIIKRIDD